MRDTGITDAVRADFDACLTGAHEDVAMELAARLVADGVKAEDVLLDLVAPAQVRVGERWASGEWTVAQEHAATRVSRRAVDAATEAALGAAGEAGLGAAGEAVEPGSRGNVLVACSDGEWHVLPSHILAAVLRLRGFRVRSLGGHVSPEGLLSDVHQNGPDVVALSCTLPWNLPRAYRQIETCRWAGVPVMTGGAGFGPDGTWGYALGADLYAADARDAADTLLRDWPPELRGRSSVEPGAVEAYATLVRQHPLLLGHLADTLRRARGGARADTRPGTRDPGREGERAGAEQDEDAEFLGRLLDSLAAAVFVDDARVFTGQLSFAAAYIAARPAGTGCLRALTDTLADRLPGSPRILNKVEAGRSWLDEQPGSPSDPPPADREADR